MPTPRPIDRRRFIKRLVTFAGAGVIGGIPLAGCGGSGGMAAGVSAPQAEVIEPRPSTGLIYHDGLKWRMQDLPSSHRIASVPEFESYANDLSGVLKNHFAEILSNAIAHHGVSAGLDSEAFRLVAEHARRTQFVHNTLQGGLAGTASSGTIPAITLDPAAFIDKHPHTLAAVGIHEMTHIADFATDRSSDDYEQLLREARVEGGSVVVTNLVSDYLRGVTGASHTPQGRYAAYQRLVEGISSSNGLPSVVRMMFGSRSDQDLLRSHVDREFGEQNVRDALWASNSLKHHIDSPVEGNSLLHAVHTAALDASSARRFILRDLPPEINAAPSYHLEPEATSTSRVLAALLNHSTDFTAMRSSQDPQAALEDSRSVNHALHSILRQAWGGRIAAAYELERAVGKIPQPFLTPSPATELLSGFTVTGAEAVRGNEIPEGARVGITLHYTGGSSRQLNLVRQNGVLRRE